MIPLDKWRRLFKWRNYNDTLNGGIGSDTAVFSDQDNQIDLTITTSQDTGDGSDTLLSIENVNAGGGDDTLNWE